MKGFFGKVGVCLVFAVLFLITLQSAISQNNSTEVESRYLSEFRDQSYVIKDTYSDFEIEFEEAQVIFEDGTEFTDRLKYSLNFTDFDDVRGVWVAYLTSVDTISVVGVSHYQIADMLLYFQPEYDFLFNDSYGNSVYSASKVNTTLLDPHTVEIVSAIPFYDPIISEFDNASMNAWWKFSEGTGSSVNDFKDNPNSHDGTISNTAQSVWVPGLFTGDYALEFQNTDGNVDIINEVDFENHTQIEMNAVVYFNSSVEGYYWSLEDTLGNQNWRVGYQGAVLHMEMETDGVDCSANSGPWAPSNFTWHNISYRYDGSNAYLEVDNVVRINTSCSGSINNIGTDGEIGRYKTNWFRGAVATVGVWAGVNLDAAAREDFFETSWNRNESNVIPEVVSGSEEFTLVDMLDGKLNLTLSYNVSDANGDQDLNSCLVAHNDGISACSLNSSSNVCTCAFSFNQSPLAYFIPQVNDTVGSVGSGTNYSAVRIDYDYFADVSKVNGLSAQNYLVRYNLTSYVGNVSDIAFQGAPGESVKTLNLTNNTLVQDNTTEYSADFINEDAGFTISGSEFVADTAYNIVRQFYYNNSLEKDLPQVELTINLSDYVSGALAEEQDGILWPDLSSNYVAPGLSFNVSAQNASTNQLYRYSYDARLVTFNGSTDATSVEVGSNKEWTYAGTYLLNFELSGKTIKKTIQYSSLPEYGSRIGNYTKTFVNSTGQTYPDTFTDQNTSFLHSFTAADDDPVFSFVYLTPIGSSQGGGGGGGGGGGSSPSEPEIIEVEVRRFNGTLDFGQDLYAVTLFSLPKENYKEFLVTAVGGDVEGDLEISDNILPYIVDYGFCKLDSDECDRYVNMTEGEKRIFFIRQSWTKDFLGVLESFDNQVVAEVSVIGPGNQLSWPIIVKTGGFFESSLKLSDLTGGAISHGTAAFLMFGLFIVAMMFVGLFVILSV